MKLLALMTFLFSVNAHAGFTRGSKFNIVALEGRLKIYCGYDHTTVQCRDMFMEPWPYDKFEGPKVRQGELIELRSINKGSEVVAVSSYDGFTGKSDYFDLGVYSLFQKPLLRKGTNRIEYKITDQDGQTLKRGRFQVQVGQLRTRRCETRETYRSLEEECAHVYSICQQYFKAMNFCRE